MSAGIAGGGLLGVGIGIMYCHGSSEIVLLTKECVKLLIRDRALYGADLVGLGVSTVLSAILGWFGQLVPGPDLHLRVQSTAVTILLGGLVMEIWSLLSLSRTERSKNRLLGVHGVRLIGMEHFPSPTLRSVCVHMSCVYSVLLLTYCTVFSGKMWCYHQDPALQRPIATLRYMEWSVAVPLLMWIVGRISLEHPVHVVLRPIVQTLTYVWLAWAAQLVVWPWVRSMLVCSSFTIFFEASLGQWRWIRKEMPIQSGLVVYQITVYLLYGIVYLLAFSDSITPEVEDTMYTCMDVTAKLGHTTVFVALRYAEEVDTFFTSVGSYLDLLMGLRALVGAQFDVLIQCQKSPHGLFIHGANLMLERGVGKALIGRPLEEICFRDRDRIRLRQHEFSRTQDRKPTNEASGAWERQEALRGVADLLSVDVVWKHGSRGYLPAELFLAGACVSQDSAMNLVLVGMRFSTEQVPFTYTSEQNSSLDLDFDSDCSVSDAGGEAVSEAPHAEPMIAAPQELAPAVRPPAVKAPVAKAQGSGFPLPELVPVHAPPVKASLPPTVAPTPPAPSVSEQVSTKKLTPSISQLTAENLLAQVERSTSLRERRKSRGPRSLASESIRSEPLAPVLEVETPPSTPDQMSQHSAQSKAPSEGSASSPSIHADAMDLTNLPDDRGSDIDEQSLAGFTRQISHHSNATSLQTYRTSAGTSKKIQAQVQFLSKGGQLSALSFNVASSCPEYKRRVDAEQTLWDWEKLVISGTEVEQKETLGRGSFASVRRVLWRGSFYAEKVLTSQAWLERKRGFPVTVRREISILAQLSGENHPHLCRLVALITQPKVSLLFELCEGGTVFDFLSAPKFSLTGWQRHAILSQMAQGLSLIHRLQIVHRDLKSNNVLFLSPLQENVMPHVKVTDVGLARWLADGDSTVSDQLMDGLPDASSERQDDSWEGPMPMTPIEGGELQHWRAPEMGTGLYGLSVDIFAYGVLTFEILTGLPSLPWDWRQQLEELTGFQAWRQKNERPEQAERPADAPLPDGLRGSRALQLAAWCVCDASGQRPDTQQLLETLAAVDALDMDSVCELRSSDVPAIKSELAGG